MKLFFIVGEDSGDALAAPLITALKEQYGEQFECLGVGGPKMNAAGFNELLPMDQISIMGIWEVLPKIPRLLRLKGAIIEEIEKQQPDAVITVDFPDFNFMIAQGLKKRGTYKGKIIHYVAPSVWAWRPGRAKTISRFLDGIMCLFPMEVDYFKKHKLKAVYTGHPVVASNCKQADPQEFKDANTIPEDAKTIGVFFGSREGEFKKLSPILMDALSVINEIENDVRIIAPTLAKYEYDVQSLLKGFKLPVYVTANPMVKWEAFKSCDIAIAVSGTVALELAYAGVPHIIAYKVNPITALLVKVMAKVKHIHLANILLNDSVVPECLQGKCNSENIARIALDLLNSEEEKNKQKQSFEKLGHILGDDNTKTPSQKAAEFIASCVSK